MKTLFTTSSKLILLGLGIMISILANAQNWQYVGTPYFNQTPTFYTSLDLPDMEMNTSGDIFVAYTLGVSDPKTLKIAKYSGGNWTQLPPAGTLSAVGYLDLEVQGSNYYFAYSRVIGSKDYVFVTKYDGSSGWTKVGDSLLIGTAGNSNFEFLLDNNGVPTILGRVANSNSGTNKEVMQFTGGTWASVYTFTNSGGTVFQENAAVFDSQNKLYCLTTGYFITPTVKYYTLVHKISSGTGTIVGDSLFGLTGNNRIKVNASDVPFICMNNTLAQRVMAYRLNSTTWSMMGDTSVKTGNMYSMDITSDNKVVFYGLKVSPSIKKRIYYYDNSTTVLMDTINATAMPSAIGDVLIPPGTNDIYAVVQEVKTGAVPDISVMKHAGGSTTPTGIKQTLSASPLLLFPNPSTGVFFIERGDAQNSSSTFVAEIYNSMGQKVIDIHTTGEIDLLNQAKGIYFARIHDGNIVYEDKIIIH